MNHKLIRGILLPLLLMCSLNGFAFDEYWGDGNGDRVVRLEMLTHPQISGYENVSARVLSGNSMEVSFSVDLEWLNYRRVAATHSFQRTALVRQIQYRYKIGCRNGSSTIWLTDDEKLETINVVRDDDDPGCGSQIRTYFTKNRNWNVSHSQTVDISELLYNRSYTLVVHFEAKITEVYEAVNNTATEQRNVILHSSEDWYRWQSADIIKDAGGTMVTVQRLKTTTPRISCDERVNPVRSVSTYDKNVVYNHPDAKVEMNLHRSGLPGIVKRSSTSYYPYSALVFGDGIGNPLPTSFKLVFSSNGCYTYHCDNGVNKNNPVHYIYDRERERAYGQILLGRSILSTEPRIRYANLVLQPKDNGEYERAFTSLIDDGYANEDGTPIDESSENWFAWKLNLSQLTDEAGKKSLAGSNFTLVNVNGYFDASNRNYNNNDKLWRMMGYDLYGPASSRSNLIYSTSADKELYPKSNAVYFEVLPAAVIDSLSADEKAPKTICRRPASTVGSAIESADELIILRAKQIDFGGYSHSHYAPRHDWEISYDCKNWKSLKNSRDFARYVKKVADLNFPIIVDDSTDIMLSTDILSTGRKLYFRQTLALMSFSSDEWSPLYSYQGEDGRWYIKVASDDCYSYTSYAEQGVTVTATDREGKNYDFESETICLGERGVARGLSWRADTVPSDAVYLLYVIDEDGNATQIAKENSYALPEYPDESRVYRAVVKFCGDSIYKDVKVNVNSKLFIPIDSLRSADAVVVGGDSAEAKASLLLHGSEGAEIFFDDPETFSCEYLIREVLPYEAPEGLIEDFSAYGYDSICAYVDAKGWDIAADLGAGFEDSSLNKLRDYCTRKLAEESAAALAEYDAWYAEKTAYRTMEGAKAVVLAAEGDTARYYVRKQSRSTSCFSDSLLLELRRADDVSGGRIQFDDAVYAPDSSIVLNYGDSIPDVVGHEAVGGYKKPDGTDDLIYRYVWIFRYEDEPWQTLKTHSDRTGKSSGKTLWLTKSNKVVDRPMELARIAISMDEYGETSQICDTSNILRLDVVPSIDGSKVSLTGDNSCPGDFIEVKLSQSIDFSRFELIYECSDSSVLLTPSATDPRTCRFVNARRSFTVKAYLRSLDWGSIGKRHTINVNVVPVYADFAIEEGGIETDIFANPEADYVLQPGTLIRLVNKSEGEELSYRWTLQLQDFFGDEIAGEQTDRESPYCYLYNPGYNKIRLEVSGKSGSISCTSSVTAENIYVIGGSERTEQSFNGFLSDEAAEAVAEGTPSASGDGISVYPTYLSASSRTLNFSSEAEQISYIIFDEMGALLTSGTVSGNGSAIVPESSSAVLILIANNQPFKILNR